MFTPTQRGPIAQIDLSELRDSFEALFVFPLRLTQHLLPAMRAWWRQLGCSSPSPAPPELDISRVVLSFDASKCRNYIRLW